MIVLELTKDSIDLGIVTTRGPEMAAFYRDLLGFTEEPQMPFPAGGTMYRLRCGTSLIKIVAPDQTPSESAPPGPIPRATGLRYWTISVSNLEAAAEACAAAGHKLVVPVTEIRPGTTIAIVLDPDGNWVELLQTG